ncbi:MAG: 2-hydroxyacid dehydrogenase [Phycisphaerales bacterium JB043]
MTKILVTRAYPGTLDVPGAEIVVARDGAYFSHEELLDTVRVHAPMDAIMTVAYDRVDDSFLDAAGPQLKGVCQYAVGYDNIDVDACNARGVVVTNSPDGVTEGTADMAWLLMMAAGRRLTEAGRYARSDGYVTNGQLGMRDFIGADFTGATLLIVGAGRIGFATAMRSIGWGMRVQYVARSPHYEFELAPLHATKVDLDIGLRNADFVSVHTPLTDETRHLINAERLALMKPSAVLVNTARGPVIDEEALVQALKAGLIGGAGLDVYEHEPEVHPELKTLDNVVLTPHIGSASRGSRLMTTDIVSANLRAVLAGDTPPNEVRPADRTETRLLRD